MSLYQGSEMAVIRTGDLSHSRKGWAIRLRDVPLWRLVYEAAYDAALDALDHPCCHDRSCDCGNVFCDGEEEGHTSSRTIWGWAYDKIPNEKVQQYIQLAQFRLVNNRVYNFGMDKEKDVALIPVSRETALAISADFVEAHNYLQDEDEVHDPDKIRATFEAGHPGLTAPQRSALTYYNHVRGLTDDPEILAAIDKAEREERESHRE